MALNRIISEHISCNYDVDDDDDFDVDECLWALKKCATVAVSNSDSD